MSNQYISEMNFGEPKRISSSIKINKPIPIDCRYLVSSLAKLDEELPKQYRYTGLIFFVPDSNVNIGTGNKANFGIYYCFDNDINTPVPLHDLSLRYIVHQIKDITDYSRLLDRLNSETFSKPGNIVDIKDLGIQVIFTGDKWKYFNGKYTLNSIDDWANIPSDLKEPNSVVLTKNDGKQHVINNDLDLTSEVMSVNDESKMSENNRFYLLNNTLFYRLNDINYKLTNNTRIYLNQNLVEGDNELIHSLKTTNCLVQGFYNNYKIDFDVILFEDKIIIKSGLNLNDCTILITDIN